ncbi:sensor histidine kinase [Sporosarcina ureae]|uniref:sensor histidine kinase n=1 Tax=Sporosarcina ureae TaxID=1571 RepID=UPI0028B2681C|nr:HAMP domain-containing sensor histidine kinase [Sporosarcina ureae]
MNKNMKLAIWSALVTLVLIALPSIIHYAPQLVGKSFTDQEDFTYRMEQEYDNLSATVLNPVDLKKAEKELTVSLDEITEYRQRYGTLSEQLDNIQQQYAERIADAKSEENETLLLALVKERNTKLEDIQKNFESDSYVEDKIRSEKAKALARQIKETENNRQTNIPIAYDLVNVETGERFTRGDVEVTALFQQKFTEATGYFKANSAVYDNGYSDYSMEQGSMFTDDDVEGISNPPQYFEGTIIIPSDATILGAMAKENDQFIRGKYMVYGLWVLGVLALVALFTVMKFQKEWILQSKLATTYSRWKLDVKVVLLLLTAFILTLYIESAIFNIFNQFRYVSLGTISNMAVSFLLIGVLFTALLAFQAVHLFRLYREPERLMKDWRDSFTVQFARDSRDTFSNRTVGVQLSLLLIIFFLAGLGLAGVFMQPVLIVVYAFCVLFVALPALFLFVKKTAYLNRILAATNDMAAGHLTQAIPVKGKSQLAKHAANLNNLREGVRVSINEQAKSERLKTELITNVSHDLRTPLTSIITYTDLLKDETLTAEERAKYVGILDQKSQRLKTLIEDLFEVSKMASGNLEMVKQRVDLNQLIQQALAEHAEQFTEQDLHVRTTLPEEPVFAMVDGQKWWRVLDNLFINILKYSLPGTRVYVNLQQVGSTARIVLKNVARYELGDTTDELFERFKRGDASRQTEGSGLGLAIAQSIVELHGGRMEVEVDGDLFKVTIDVVSG